MAYSLIASASRKAETSPKNRVWDVSAYSVRLSPVTGRPPAQPRRKIRPTPTKPVSGIPYWPSKDPIEEDGGLNLYGFVRNDGINIWDILGNDPYYEAEVKCAVVLEIGHTHPIAKRVKDWNEKRMAFEKRESNHQKFPAQMSGIGCAIPTLSDAHSIEGFRNESPYESMYPISGIPKNRGFLGAATQEQGSPEPAQNGGLNPVKDGPGTWDPIVQTHGFLEYVKRSWDAALTAGLNMAGSNYTYNGNGGFDFHDNCRCDNIVVIFTFENNAVRDNYTKYINYYRNHLPNSVVGNATSFSKYNFTPHNLDSTKDVAGQQVKIFPTTNQRVTIPRGANPGIFQVKAK